MSDKKRFTNEAGAPVADNTNIMTTAGPHSPAAAARHLAAREARAFRPQGDHRAPHYAKGWGTYGTLR